METPDTLIAAIQAGEITQPILLTGPATIQWENVRDTIRKGIGTEIEYASLEPDGNSIKIDQVRALLATLSRTAFTKTRLVWISPIDRIEIAAANALLKELEESSAQNQFIVATSYPGRVLPTIVSRCQIRRMAGLESTSENAPDTAAILTEALSSQKKDALSDDELAAIETYLVTEAKQNAANPYLKATLTRLRDFYKIRSYRGNQKLATQVLLATLSQMRNTR